MFIYNDQNNTIQNTKNLDYESDYDYGDDYDSCDTSYYDTDEAGQCHHKHFPQTPIENVDIFKDRPVKRCCQEHGYVHYDTCKVGE